MKKNQFGLLEDLTEPGLVKKSNDVSWKNDQIYKQTNFEKNTTYFHIMGHEESHAVRRREILKKHPEIQVLFGNDINSAWLGITFVLVQFSFISLFNQLSLFWFVITAYVFGATLSHALHVLVHDFTHFTCFESIALNKLMAIWANFGQGVPSAITFGRYRYCKLKKFIFFNLLLEFYQNSKYLILVKTRIISVGMELQLTCYINILKTQIIHKYVMIMKQQDQIFLLQYIIKCVQISCRSSYLFEFGNVRSRSPIQIRIKVCKRASYEIFICGLPTLILCIKTCDFKATQAKCLRSNQCSLCLICGLFDSSIYRSIRTTLAIIIYLFWVECSSFCCSPATIISIILIQFPQIIHKEQYIQQIQGTKIILNRKITQLTVAEHYEFVNRMETYDYIGWANFFVLNIGYHTEHHDFPMIPWTRLPLLRKMVPEYYENLPCHTNYVHTLLAYIFDGYIGPFSRIVRSSPVYFKK